MPFTMRVSCCCCCCYRCCFCFAYLKCQGTYGNFDAAEYLAKREEPDAWTSFSRYLGSVFSSSNAGNANIGDSPAKGEGYKYITEHN